MTATTHTARAEHFTVAMLSRHWRVDQRTIRKLIRCRQLRAHRVGRVWRVSPEEVERYEREQRPVA